MKVQEPFRDYVAFAVFRHEQLQTFCVVPPGLPRQARRREKAYQLAKPGPTLSCTDDHVRL